MRHRKGTRVQDRPRRRVFSHLRPVRASGVAAGAAALLLAAALAPASARAQDLALDPFTHAGAAGLGLAGGGRASSGMLDNIWYGSAVLALDARYDVVADGFLDPGAWRGFKIAALDSRSSVLTMGLCYSFAYQADMPMTEGELPGWRLPEEGEENDAFAHHAAAGLAFSPDEERRWSLGLHGGYFWRRAAIAGDGGGIRLGGSVAARPHETFTLSLGGTAALLVDGARGYEDQSRLELGGRWEPVEDLALVADGGLPLAPVDGLDVALGAEWVAGGLVPLRVGWSRDAGDVRHGLGAGGGIAAEYLDLQYGIWIDLGPDPEGLELPRHALTLSMQF